MSFRHQRQSFNLATAFGNHRQAILRYMYDLEVSFTNSEAEEGTPAGVELGKSTTLDRKHGAELGDRCRNAYSWPPRRPDGCRRE